MHIRETDNQPHSHTLKKAEKGNITMSFNTKELKQIKPTKTYMILSDTVSLVCVTPIKTVTFETSIENNTGIETTLQLNNLPVLDIASVELVETKGADGNHLMIKIACITVDDIRVSVSCDVCDDFAQRKAPHNCDTYNLKEVVKALADSVLCCCTKNIDGMPVLESVHVSSHEGVRKIGGTDGMIGYYNTVMEQSDNYQFVVHNSTASLIVSHKAQDITIHNEKTNIWISYETPNFCVCVHEREGRLTYPNLTGAMYKHRVIEQELLVDTVKIANIDRITYKGTKVKHTIVIEQGAKGTSAKTLSDGNEASIVYDTQEHKKQTRIGIANKYLQSIAKILGTKTYSFNTQSPRSVGVHKGNVQIMVMEITLPDDC